LFSANATKHKRLRFSTEAQPLLILAGGTSTALCRIVRHWDLTLAGVKSSIRLYSIIISVISVIAGYCEIAALSPIIRTGNPVGADHRLLARKKFEVGE